MATGAQVIPAPLAAAPRVSLLSAVLRPDPVAGWLNGITFDPEAQEPTLSIDGYWWDPCIPGMTDPATVEDGPGTKTPGSRPTAPLFVPWAAVEGDTCSAANYRRQDFAARARRVLEAATPAKVEWEFWTGTLAQVGNLPNRWLASPDADTLNSGAATPLVYALTDLQEYLASTITGRGMIHVTPSLLTLWLSAGVVRREGNVWLDAKDNLVVAGDGYPGTGPDGSGAGTRMAWAYATGMVHYLESEVTVLPGDLASAIDRSTNTVTYRAERTVLPWWDLQAHAAVLVDLCTTCCDTPVS